MKHDSPKVQTTVSGVHLFGFDLDFLENQRVSNVINSNRCKRPFADIGIAQQNKRLVTFGTDIQQKIKPLITKYNLVPSTQQKEAILRFVELEINGEIIIFDFSQSLKLRNQIKLDSIVRACDEALISRDNYRRLAKVNPRMEREYLVSERKAIINDEMKKQIPTITFKINKSIQTISSLENQPEHIEEAIVNDIDINNGAYRSITNILKMMVPIWLKLTPPVIKSDDTLFLKLGGDGRNVGRNQNHVISTICLLNEKDQVLKPTHQFRFVYNNIIYFYLFLFNI
jgi:hypothetical protein